LTSDTAHSLFWALALFLQAKEASKDYAEAAKAYEKARDMDAVVRLLIDHLGAPERAGAIVRQTRSSEGAQLIAKYCKSVGDFRGAIEFLLLAKKRDESFALAAENNEMKLYVQGLRIALAASTAGTDPAALMNAAAAGGAAAAAALAEVQVKI
jgi:tetratricopeptide (TPR) repeat protein